MDCCRGSEPSNRILTTSTASESSHAKPIFSRQAHDVLVEALATVDKI